MATAPMQLDQPPQQPPAVTNQQGAGGPPVNAAAAIAPPQGQGAPGAGAQPQGALLAQAEAVKKVLNEMARANDKFAPYAQRAIEEIDSGVGTALGNGQPQDQQQSTSARPPEGADSQTFPG